MGQSRRSVLNCATRSTQKKSSDVFQTTSRHSLIMTTSIYRGNFVIDIHVEKVADADVKRFFFSILQHRQYGKKTSFGSDLLRSRDTPGDISPFVQKVLFFFVFVFCWHIIVVPFDDVSE